MAGWSNKARWGMALVALCVLAACGKSDDEPKEPEKPRQVSLPADFYAAAPAKTEPEKPKPIIEPPVEGCEGWDWVTRDGGKETGRVRNAKTCVPVLPARCEAFDLVTRDARMEEIKREPGGCAPAPVKACAGFDLVTTDYQGKELAREVDGCAPAPTRKCVGADMVTFDYRGVEIGRRTSACFDEAAAEAAAQKAALAAMLGKGGVVNRPAPEKEEKYRLDDSSFERLNSPEDVSTLRVNEERMILAGSPIAVVSTQGINSQVAGSFRVAVERDVYGGHGDLVLLPKGSSIVCDYDSLEKQGDTRLAFRCLRAVRPDGSAVLLTESGGAAADGKWGMIGPIDSRIWARYGDATVMALLSGLVGLSGQSGGAAGGAASGAANQLATVTGKILDEQLALAPVLTVAPGSRMLVVPRVDIILRKPEVLK